MEETAIRVIRARPSDLPLVKSLFRSIERESQPDNPDAMDRAEAGLDMSLGEFDFLSSDWFWLLLALRDGTAAGYATLVRMPKADARVAALYLDELHVLREHRRRGVASALLSEATRIAKEVRAWRIRLLVSPQNQGARSLYRSHGFVESEEVILCEKNTQESGAKGSEPHEN